MKRRSLAFIFLPLLFALTANGEGTAFQIGESFERTFHTNLEEIPPALHRAAQSVAHFDSSTAFYIGRHNDKEVMVTTAHGALKVARGYNYDLEHFKNNKQALCRVFIEDEDSSLREFEFSLLNKFYECKELIAIYPEFDLAFFEIKKNDEFDLSELGINFTAPEPFSRGEPAHFFSTSGFNNPGYLSFDLAHTAGRLCSPLIDSSAVDYLVDNNTFTGDTILVPSIPIGCDVSPGDSGSPFLNDEGQLLGVLWSSSNSGDPRISDQEYLEDLIFNGEPYSKNELNFIWRNSNYSLSLDKALIGIEESLKSCESVACQTLKSIISSN